MFCKSSAARVTKSWPPRGKYTRVAISKLKRSLAVAGLSAHGDRFNVNDVAGRNSLRPSVETECWPSRAARREDRAVEPTSGPQHDALAQEGKRLGRDVSSTCRAGRQRTSNNVIRLARRRITTTRTAKHCDEIGFNESIAGLAT